MDTKSKDHDVQRWSNRGWMMFGVLCEGNQMQVRMVSNRRTDAMVQSMAEQWR